MEQNSLENGQKFEFQDEFDKNGICSGKIAWNRQFSQLGIRNGELIGF